MKEIWKQVVEYESYYEVSNLGNVRSIDRTIINSIGKVFNYKSRLLKPAKNKYGYLQVGVSINSKIKSFTVHSLVAKAFIKNPKNKPTVNHKDGIKINNNVNNLEWATRSENSIHALKNGLRIMPNAWIGKFGSKHGASKKIIQYTKDNIYVNEYGSIIEAFNLLNINASSISRVCNGKLKSAGGYIWKYNVQ